MGGDILPILVISIFRKLRNLPDNLTEVPAQSTTDMPRKD
jgi:hypothetical protein